MSVDEVMHAAIAEVVDRLTDLRDGSVSNVGVDDPASRGSVVLPIPIHGGSLGTIVAIR